MHRKTIGLTAGLLMFTGMLLVPPPAALGAAAWHTAALTVLMGTWWISEAIPIAATALLPTVLLPLLGVAGIEDALAPYAHPLIFLFLGGFIIAAAMERWNLHERIALNIVRLVGVEPRSIVLGFILASAFLSMWVSNTATALMMLPIALSVLRLTTAGGGEGPAAPHFTLCLLLGVAYGCNIGGMGTLIGTPPNALLAAYMENNYGVEISFAGWMVFALPFLAVALPLLYGVLTRLVYPIRLERLPGGRQLFRRRLEALGTLSTPEKRVGLVFTGTALLWIVRPLLSGWVPQLTDTGIAMAAALACFVLPAGAPSSGDSGYVSLLSWSDTDRLPWGVLILFGGGLSLASAISDTGLATWLGASVQGLGGWPVLLLVTIVVALVVFLTEITSNTATSAAFLPIMGSVAVGLGQPPLLLALPVALSASCAFMLPVATPPNAIIYGSGEVTIPQMARAGLWLNLLFIVLVSAWSYFGVPLVFGV